MKLGIIAFSQQGFDLAQRIEGFFDDTHAVRCEKGGLDVWTKAHFEDDALIFISSCGIAVRAISPYIKSKTTDPAVVVVDEKGSFAIPLLSGHIGGANELAVKVASLIGAVPVVTTATDINGLFAVDTWARRNGLAIADPHKIVNVSSKLLSGETVRLRSDFPIVGKLPKGIELTDGQCDIRIGVVGEDGDALCLIPKAAVLGVGCRRDTPADTIEAAFEAFPVHPAAIEKVCSIDLKANEAGLIEFCRNHGWSFETFTADELSSAPGEYTASSFVRSITGVDNVCERSAVMGSSCGKIVIHKTAGNGVTMALAVKNIEINMED